MFEQYIKQQKGGWGGKKKKEVFPLQAWCGPEGG